MDWDGLLAGAAMFIVVIVPVFGLTARFAFNPLLETILRLRETSARQSAASDERLLQLTQELHRLSAAVERLEEATSFEQELRHPSLASGRVEGGA